MNKNIVNEIINKAKNISGRDISVIYHAHCSDGFGAAWAFSKFFGNEVKYFPMSHGQQLPLDLGGKILFILDFSFPKTVINSLFSKYKYIAILDHHKSAEAELGSMCYSYFDMNRSGAGITWDLLSDGEGRPKLISYIEDFDLWKLNIPDSLKINYLIYSMEENFKIWDEFADKLENNSDLIKIQAEAVYKQVSKMIEVVCRNSRLITFEGYQVPISNCHSMLRTEAGNILCKGHPFAMLWSQDREGQFTYSLRSDKHGVDVSKIAAKYGAGGHMRSAGLKHDKLFS